MSTQPFNGTVNQMKAANKFLASEDFIGRGEVELEISGVFQDTGEVMQDGKKKDFFSIGFQKTPKRMVLNATNRRALAYAFDDVDVVLHGRILRIAYSSASSFLRIAFLFSSDIIHL